MKGSGGQVVDVVARSDITPSSTPAVWHLPAQDHHALRLSLCEENVVAPVWDQYATRSSASFNCLGLDLPP